MRCTKFFLICVFCILSSSYAETLWFWDFTEEPSGWSHGDHWNYTADGASLYYYDPLYSKRLVGLTTSLLSQDFILPPSVEGNNLMISFTHALTYMGVIWEQPMWTDIEVRVFLNSDTSYAYAYNEYTEGVIFWYDTLSTEDYGQITLLLSQVEPGDDLSFEFYFNTYLYGVINSTFIDWTITDLTVETVSTALEQDTWGSIKQSF